MNQRIVQGLAAGFLLSALSACSSDSDSVGGDEVTYKGLKLQILSTANLSSELKDIADKVNAEQPVSFSAISKEFLRMHLSESEDLEKYRTEFSEMIKGIATADLGQFKVAYESVIERKLNSPLKYNRNAVTIPHLTSDSRLQCYSATSFFQLALRELLGAAKFEESRHVLIYEPGHILPGSVTSQNELVGIETTAKGSAKILYGKTENLSGAITIVDAGLWMLAEIFKNKLQNASEVKDKIIEITAEKYGIVDLNRFTRPDTQNASLLSQVINQSLFGFGNVEVPEGDIDRQSFEEVNRSSISNPALLVQQGIPPPVGPPALPSFEVQYSASQVLSLQMNISFDSCRSAMANPSIDVCSIRWGERQFLGSAAEERFSPLRSRIDRIFSLGEDFEIYREPSGSSFSARVELTLLAPPLVRSLLWVRLSQNSNGSYSLQILDEVPEGYDPFVVSSSPEVVSYYLELNSSFIQ